MRIEGTYQFDSPIEEVFAALTDPDTMRKVIPGCERLIQLGPPDVDGTILSEARIRLRPSGALYTVEGAIERLRKPSHIRLNLKAHGPLGTLGLHGSVDLVARDERTVAAYVWDLDIHEVPDVARRELESGAGTEFVQQVGADLAAKLRATDDHSFGMSDALPVLRADSARGKIILLPAEASSEPVAIRFRPLLRRGLWAAAGLVVGLGTLAVAVSILRRWNAGREGQA